MSRRPRKHGYPRHQRTVPPTMGERVRLSSYVSGADLATSLANRPGQEAQVLAEMAMVEQLRQQTAIMYAAAGEDGIAPARSTARTRRRERRHPTPASTV